MSRSETELDFSFRIAQQARTTRFSYALGAVICVFGIISYMVPIGQFNEIYGVYQGIFGAIAVGAGALLGAFTYLQSGANRGPDLAVLVARETTLANGRIDELKERLDKLSIDLPASGLTPDRSTRDAIVESLKEMVGAGAIAEIFEEKASELRESMSHHANLERLRTSFTSVRRIEREIRDLRLRSNLNLLIGMFITGLGLYMLWETVGQIEYATGGKLVVPRVDFDLARDLMLPIVPRVSLVIFIEIFAFFFLRLYRDGLSEIKYFQNELTNIESKMIAVEVSLIWADSESLKVALDSLAKTERHFILQKGQTTVDLERAKAESELTRNVLKALPELFKRSDSK